MTHENNNYRFLVTFIFSSFLLWGNVANALDVNITEDLAYVDTVHQGKIIRIKRIQDQDNVLTGGFTKTSRKCPPYCIRPIHVAPEVKTFGELEVLDFIANSVNNGTGVMVDARLEAWYMKGTIPGSINIPFTTFSETNNKLVLSAALTKLGVRKKSKQSFITSMWESLHKLVKKNGQVSQDYWDFSEAKDVLLWCNGMWCGQSPQAIHNLIALGYPPEKIFYYRGGMQAWLLLGLTIVVPEEGSISSAE